MYVLFVLSAIIAMDDIKVQLPAVIGLAYGCARENKVLHYIEINGYCVVNLIQKVIELSGSSAMKDELSRHHLPFLHGHRGILHTTPELGAG
ncbi:hypothetical protein PoB_002361600 [Plakobranchus ocellatus]|uniref:Uncharacterized protein n=1 Tax=Plakobranchus ocellatus TaxID=259542 RepID=A0AAV3ZMB7_9GAST|nr:hypothetical protein PoB_002361600 [Plakobranchus ocellatus]